jgi:hypothetical protein
MLNFGFNDEFSLICSLIYVPVLLSNFCATLFKYLISNEYLRGIVA